MKVDVSNDPVSHWADRWRASRGSSPVTPSSDIFDLLISMPVEIIDEVAEMVGENADRLRLWKAVANDPARDRLAALRMSQFPVYLTLRDVRPMTDDELSAHLHRKKSEVSPRRVELCRQGLVREVEKRTTPSGRKSAVWGVVPPAEIEEASREAAEKGLRRKSLDKYTLDQKVQMARHLVRDDAVNAVLVEDGQRSKAADRARREARSANIERERERREHSERIRQAERDASPDLVFLKAVAQLRKAVDAVMELDRVIRENLESQRLYGSADIAPDRWPEVNAEVEALIQVATSTKEQLSRLVEDDVIDIEPYEEDKYLEIETPSSHRAVNT
ncbi:MAG: hypothetical protein M3N31_09530 [Actinomycetota bacterium]|nr:hypothetical protein [Actinomycetota bacterium]